jgi:hypothetical protein
MPVDCNNDLFFAHSNYTYKDEKYLRDFSLNLKIVVQIDLLIDSSPKNRIQYAMFCSPEWNKQARTYLRAAMQIDLQTMILEERDDRSLFKT